VTFYHYTSAARLPMIIESGVILPTESNVSMMEAHAGPDVVWLLDGPIDDASHGLDGSIHDKRSAFIEVEIPAIRWLNWWATATMKPAWRDAMISAGGGPNAAARWYVWPARIHRHRWVRTEVIT
jgi:hypothetical protein